MDFPDHRMILVCRTRHKRVMVDFGNPWLAVEQEKSSSFRMRRRSPVVCWMEKEIGFG